MYSIEEKKLALVGSDYVWTGAGDGLNADVPADADFLSRSIETRHLSEGTIQLSWADIAKTGAAYGTIKLQGSVDGTNYQDIASMTHTILADGAGFMILQLSSIKFPLVRINYAHADTTAGDLNFRYFLRANS